jgi:hypothetical protein
MRMPHPKGPIVVVFGSNSPHEGDFDYAAARELGRLLAQAGYESLPAVTRHDEAASAAQGSRRARHRRHHLIFLMARLHPMLIPTKRSSSHAVSTAAPP